jgi:hypothetical protein
LEVVTASGLHPRGLFGHIEGREVPLLPWGDAGLFGAQEDWVSMERRHLPRGVVALPHSGLSGASTVMVARRLLRDIRSWKWYVRYDDEWCWVGNVRDGDLLIHTDSAMVASSAPAWEGHRNDGWHRWVAADGLEIEARSEPVDGSVRR